MVIGLCERFHCLPSMLLRESSELIYLAALAELGKSQEEALG